MAGIFYSLQETAQKLKKSENDVKQLIKDGKLRVFYDGSNPLFKIEEVESLLSQPADLEFEQLSLAEDAEQNLKEISPGKTAAPKEKTGQKAEKKPDDSIFLADETSSKADILNADTAILSEGLNLEGTGTGAGKLDDLLAETKEAIEGVNAPAGEGEDDLSLDTFGSGGLLDVSLQADDTSLGGILEEIYTSEGQEGQAPPSENVEMAIQGEALISETHQPVAEPAAMFMPTYAEPAPSIVSNAFGLVLFIPLLATILTLIIASIGFNGVMPSFFNKLKSGLYGIPFIWYLVAGAFILTLLIITGGSIINKEATKPKRPKAPKPEKEKKPKEKKVKAKKPQAKTK